jgi:hypothetical protein
MPTDSFHILIFIQHDGCQYPALAKMSENRRYLRRLLRKVCQGCSPHETGWISLAHFNRRGASRFMSGNSESPILAAEEKLAKLGALALPPGGHSTFYLLKADKICG